MTTNENLTGAGPFQFKPDGPLSPGEQYALPLRQLEKGKYRKYLPFDSARIVNDSTEPLSVEFNGIYDARVVPNSVTSWNEQGVVEIVVVNKGAADIAVSEITVEVAKDPYDANDAARERKSKPWLSRALNDVIPGGVPGGI